MTETILDRELIRAFPKIELHVHVEACISGERIEQLAAEAGVPMFRPVDRLFEYSSLAEFLETYEWWCDLLRTPEIAEQIGYDAAALLARDGIVYADVLAGPRYWTHLEARELIAALGVGFERAHGDGHADCRLVPSISREQPVEWALDLVEWIGRERPTRVVGLGLDGNEAVLGRTTAKFQVAYRRAGELGLGRTVHAGESAGPESVRDALDLLDVDRIDHGVRAIEDPALVRELAERRVTLDVCPSSNVITGLYPDLASHPIGWLIEADVPVTVNSDDPVAMSVSLTGEFDAVGRIHGWGLGDLADATRRAADAAFCDDDDRRALHRRIDLFLESRSESLDGPAGPGAGAGEATGDPGRR